MKRETEPNSRNKHRSKQSREKNKNFFDDDGYVPNKKDSLNQYKRKQKHRNSQDWDE